MDKLEVKAGDKVVLEAAQLNVLLGGLANRGYRVMGPTVREGAIVYDDVASLSDLPAGWTDEQDGGTYRLQRRDDKALFAYGVGPQSWKKILFPPALRLWQGTKTADGIEPAPPAEEKTKFAFVGVRACDLAAIAIQDKVFAGGEHTDSNYQALRENVFIVAVHCTQASKTCFCVSMKTGPQATSGFDLALTEVLEGKSHYFVVEIGTSRGAEILQEVECREAKTKETQKAGQCVAKAVGAMIRSMNTDGLKELFYRNYENPQWAKVAERCLSCSNCTMVCPTCFCSTLEDVSDLSGTHAERWRKWDSCFAMDFSYIHGGSVRSSTKSRYRQWITHKLATWVDQFGMTGCVGCGRCIAWCPVGIDITEEARLLRQSELKEESHGKTHP